LRKIRKERINFLAKIKGKNFLEKNRFRKFLFRKESISQVPKNSFRIFLVKKSQETQPASF